MHFVGFLFVVIYVISLYTQCLRYNICSVWFLDIRISTCLNKVCNTCTEECMPAAHMPNPMGLYYIIQ